jgi:hypothetical protein
MSSKTPSDRSSTTNRKTVDVEQYLPDRLDGVVTVSVFYKEPFTHRGYTVRPKDFGPWIDQLCKHPTVFGDRDIEQHHTTAVQFAVEQIAEQRPEWFEGEPALSESDIEDTYFQDILDPQPMTVHFDSPDDRKNIAIAVGAIVLSKIRDHAEIDRQKEISNAQDDIYRNTLRLVHERGLSAEHAKEAFDDVLKTMEANQGAFDRK